MKFVLHYRKGGSTELIRSHIYSSFRAAVLAGSKKVGHGNFHVQAPEGYAPSRTEQLLETMLRPSKRIKHDLREDPVSKEIVELGLEAR